MESHDLIHQSVSEYYSEKVKKYGASPSGVDWNGEQSQFLRFMQLCRVFDGEDLNTSTVLDFGCGYAALLEYLENNFSNFSYKGLDISEAMILEASKLYLGKENCSFSVGATIERQSVDYVIGSGIFNVKLGNEEKEWEEYIERTLDLFHDSSRAGFAFNCLTSYSDSEKMKAHLHYASPEKIFKRCKQRYSKNVALLHDYDLFEFTILVKK